MITRLTRLVLVCVFVLVAASRATAQTQVQVVGEQTTIWSATFLSVAAVVPPGTVLQVVGRRDEWYEVILPPPAFTVSSNRTGFIAVSRVVALDAADTPLPPSREVPPLDEAPGPPTLTAQSPVESTTLGPAVRGFVQLGVGHFSAEQSFDAIIGSANGVWFGGGVQVPLRSNLFVQGSFDLFRRTGERVFVFEDEVFPLGVDNTVTMVPLAATFGFRQRLGGLTPYAGAGAGVVFYSESSEFSVEGEDVSRQFFATHFLGGVEFSPVAVEVQYSHVPDALDGGVAAHFDERNLGGFQVRVKLLF